MKIKPKCNFKYISLNKQKKESGIFWEVIRPSLTEIASCIHNPFSMCSWRQLKKSHGKNEDSTHAKLSGECRSYFS